MTTDSPDLWGDDLWDDYEPPCGDPECDDWHCGRCAAHDTGHQGHYAAYCQVTKARAPHHFCCPDDCEQHPKTEETTR